MYLKMKKKKISYNSSKGCKDLNEWIEDEEEDKERKTKSV